MALGFALSCLLAPIGRACRYNVRDIGFVDLGTDQYTYYLCATEAESAAEVAGLAAISAAILEDSNVTFAVVNPDTRDGQVPARHLGGAGRRVLPAAVLLSPEERARSFALGSPVPRPEHTASNVIASMVTSPFRTELLSHLVDVYAVVVLIEGPEPGANGKTRQVVQQAIDSVALSLETLPKRIDRPPVLMTLARARFDQEQILLWSLGLAIDELAHPAVAVLYGKARRLGPVLTGAAITAARLVELLAVIGADCECGLDLAQTRGTPLPVRWGSATHARAARSLGFDPESPLVKAEVARILSGQGSGIRRSPGQYQEISLESPAVATPTSAAGSRPEMPQPPRSGAPGEPADHSALGTVLATAGWVATGLVVVVAVGSGLVWRTYRRRQKGTGND